MMLQALFWLEIISTLVKHAFFFFFVSDTMLEIHLWPFAIFLFSSASDNPTLWPKGEELEMRFLIDTEILVMGSRLIWVLNYQWFCVLMHNALCK